MAGIGTLSGIALECRDPAALAEFYRLLTGWPVVYATPEWYSIGVDDDLHLSFQLAPDHQPPTWPDPASSMQFHLHVRVHDLDVAERAVLAIGASAWEHQPDPDHIRVMADPAGHVFCLCQARR